MSVRSARRLRLAAIPLAALFAYAASIAVAAPTGADGFERATGVIAIAGLCVVALFASPAWPLTAGLVLAPLNTHWAYVGSSVPLDRVALAVGCVSLLAREIAHLDGRLRTRPIDWLLIVAGLYALVSIWWVGELGQSDSRFGLLDRFGLVPFFVFFIAPFAFRTDRERRVLLGGLVGLGLYLSITGIFEVTGARALVVPNYINDRNKGIHYERARGPFLDGSPNGMVMYCCAVASAVAFATWRSPRWRRVAFVAACLCALGTLLCLTRAVWLAAIIATPLTLLAARELRRYLLPLVAAGFVLVVGAFALVPGLYHRATERKNEQRPIYDRKNSNAAALRMIQDRPLLGFGWGRFEDESKPFYRDSGNYPLTTVRQLHNIFLSNAVELGLIGASLWLVALLAGIGGAVMRRGPPELRPWKIGLIAVAIAMVAVGAAAPLGNPLPWLLTWTWAGVAWGGRDGEPASG